MRGEARCVATESRSESDGSQERAREPRPLSSFLGAFRNIVEGSLRHYLARPLRPQPSSFFSAAQFRQQGSIQLARARPFKYALHEELMPILRLCYGPVGNHSRENRFDRDGVVGTDPRAEGVAHLKSPPHPRSQSGKAVSFPHAESKNPFSTASDRCCRRGA
jgi:hypothetical protein